MGDLRPVRWVIPFRRGRDGLVRGNFTPVERDLLVHLVDELEAMLTGDPSSDPAFERLFPAAYPGDEEASSEFRHYTLDDIRERKIDNAQEIGRALGVPPSIRRLGRVELTADQAVTWLKCLADLRLTLAVRLGIRSDGDEGPRGEESRMAREAYVWLGYVQESLVGALSR